MSALKAMVGLTPRLNHFIILKSLLLVCSIQLLEPVESRSAQKTLLDVTDRLYVYSTSDEALLDQVELRQFPYVMAVSYFMHILIIPKVQQKPHTLRRSLLRDRSHGLREGLLQRTTS